jgi:isocitrate dehydrogenase kinase/phosphatase
LSTGERIAVKEVTLRRSKKHRQQAQALQQEVKILSSLDHRNIIKYIGAECTKNTLRIFLELATDGTLKDAINEFGKPLRILKAMQNRPHVRMY